LGTKKVSGNESQIGFLTSFHSFEQEEREGTEKVQTELGNERKKSACKVEQSFDRVLLWRAAERCADV
jgi:hypothetical protein